MSKSKKNLGNNYLKIVVSIVIFLISIVVILNNSNKPEAPIIEASNQDSKIDYRVKIFKNDFIKTEYMEKDKTYITDLVDDIEVNYNYKLTNSKKFDSNYKYNITYRIAVKHNSTGKELWTEEEKLIDNKDIIPNKNTIEIQDSAIVNYDALNDKVKQFKLDYNIPIDATLEINLNVIDNNTNKTIAYTGLTTNLNTEIIDINKNEQSNIQTEIKTESKQKTPIIVIIAIIVSIISILYTAYEIYNTIRYNLSRKSYYEKAINKILKNYGDIVAELVNPVDLSKLNVIDVKNFDQMLDVEEELRIPIMFYETEKNVSGEFVIVTNEIAYRYVLKNH